MILLKNDFFGFPKVKWLHLTGEVDICVRYSCQIFSEFNVPKSLKLVNFYKVILKNKKVDVFWNMVYLLKNQMAKPTRY